MKKLFLLCIFSMGGIFAENQQPKTGPKDVDLFRKNERAVFASAEFLYWTLEEDAVDFAIRMTNATQAGTNIFPQGKYRNAKFDWDPGYRLTLGYFNAPDFWEVCAQYGWILIKGKDRAHKPSDNNLFLNSTLNLLTADTLSQAVSNIRLHYHIADLMMDRVFIPNPHLRLRLLGGIATGFLKQHWNIRYFFTSNDVERIRYKWRFRGIGFRIGVTMDWFWGNDFYLTGRWTTALLVGRYRNFYNQAIITNPGSPPRSTRFKDYRPAFTAQFLLGPSYQKSFNNARFEAFAGYEMTPWFNLQENLRCEVNDLDTFITHNRSAMLLHGVTVRVTVDF